MVTKVVAALSHKGGVGKSTVLSSVAYAIRKETHWRVVFVDVTADGLGASLLAPGCRVEYGTYAFLAGADVLHYCTIEDGAYVDTVPPGPLPKDSQLKGGRLKELIDMLKIDYNLIFVDLPGDRRGAQRSDTNRNKRGGHILPSGGAGHCASAVAA
jgi:cellulose biosynthesis protein BcsQ